MTEEPKPGTWGAVTRSTEEESRAFRKALDGLLFTRDEFLEHGPAIVLMKGFAVLDQLRALDTARATNAVDPHAQPTGTPSTRAVTSVDPRD